MSRRTLRPEERVLWATVAAGVTPLPGRSVSAEDAAAAPAVGRKQDPAAGIRAQARAAERPAPRALAPASLADRSGERRVRRGKVDLEGRIDLHGMTQDAARLALRAFLLEGRARGARVVLVITGKGDPRDRRYFGADRPGVLRRRLPDWLSEPDIRSFIGGFSPAHASHGGLGAFYVFLKRMT